MPLACAPRSRKPSDTDKDQQRHCVVKHPAVCACVRAQDAASLFAALADEDPEEPSAAQDESDEPEPAPAPPADKKKKKKGVDTAALFAALEGDDTGDAGTGSLVKSIAVHT